MTPAQTETKTDARTEANAPALPTATGELAEKHADRIVLRILETSYRLHLMIDAPLDADVGERVTGTISCEAKRIDVVPSGGRFIEPVYGRPRRIQGRIDGGDAQKNLLYIECGAPVIAHLMSSQKASNFKIGQMVCFDVQRGAKFVRV